MLLEDQKKILRQCWFANLLHDMSHHRLITKLTGLTKKQIYDWSRSQKKKRQQNKLAPNKLISEEDSNYILDIALRRHVNPDDMPILARICSISKEQVYDYIWTKKSSLKRKRDDDDVTKKKRFKCDDSFLMYLLSNAYDTGLLEEEDNLPLVGLLANVDVTYIRSFVEHRRETYLQHLLQQSVTEQDVF